MNIRRDGCADCQMKLWCSRHMETEAEQRARHEQEHEHFVREQMRWNEAIARQESGR